VGAVTITSLLALSTVIGSLKREQSRGSLAGDAAE
jgi:hypothetical protein